MFSKVIKRNFHTMSHQILHNRTENAGVLQFANIFDSVEAAPEEPVLSLIAKYQNDTFPQKADLGVGAYRDNNGKPYLFPIVKQVEREIIEHPEADKEYAPIEGLPDFIRGSKLALFGEENEAEAPRIASCQGLSGTGSLKLIADLLSKYRKQPVYISNPSWLNHPAMFKAAGFSDVNTYTYYDRKANSLDFMGMCKDLSQAPKGSIVVLHACAHNPTGCDLRNYQWDYLATIMKQREHFPLFDAAYQGFASGNLDHDAYGVRLFLKEGFQMAVAQSFAKTMGLYGERTGAMHLVCQDDKTSQTMLSQLNVIIRANYSSPPIHGAKIASKILLTPSYKKLWQDQLLEVTERLRAMRQALFTALLREGCPGKWDHILQQTGMFAMLGLSSEQCNRMIQKHHVYMPMTGRISVAGLTLNNVSYVAKSVAEVLQHKY